MFYKSSDLIRSTMELLAYLNSLTPADKEVFAVRVGTTLPHLRNCAYRERVPSAALAAQIAIHSNGAVPVEESRPKDWQRIWDPRLNRLMNAGTIVDQKGAQSSGLQMPEACGADV